MRTTGRLGATSFPLDFTLFEESSQSASVDSRVLVLIRISQRARLGATRLCQDQLTVLTVLLVSTQR